MPKKQVRKQVNSKKRPRIPRSKRKLLVACGAAALLILVLMGNLVYVGIIKGPEYAAKAQRQWENTVSLKADRGEIQDRNGNVLAESYTTYQVCANPASIGKDDRERVANILATLLNLDYDTVYGKITKVSPTTGALYQQVKIKDQVDANLVTQLSSYQLGSGVSYYADVKRNYPEGQLFAQLLGFTNIDGDGQTGVELTYNSYLAGKDGKQILETDRDGNAIIGGEEEYVEPVHGSTLITTVDTAAQNFLESALEEACTVNLAKNAYGVLVDPQTMEILAVGTYPTFDPNNPPRNDSTTLLALSRQRIVTETYEPGSVFKIITLASAIDAGIVNTATGFRCSGSLLVSGEKIKCWKTAGHGQENLQEAVANSCNPAFMSMALKLGTNTFYDYIYAFGFNDSTGSGLTGETKGTVTHKKYIREPDLARIGFGQSISCTGMQLATAAAACINGGELLQPYYISSITAPDGTVLESKSRTVIRRVISESTSKTVRTLLQGVVDSGSGRNAAIPGYSVGGKTGTSQKYDEKGRVSSTLLVASFLGFAPVEDPKYMCLIIVDEPQVPVVYGSTVAAPYVQQVLSKVLNYYGVQPDRSDSNAVSVPDLTGMTVEEAEAALRKVGLTATYMEEEKAASVQRQSPRAGNIVVSGSNVILYTAWTSFKEEQTEVEMVKMPDIMGKSRLDALDALTKAGLVMDYDRPNSAGKVTAVQYEAGQELPKGTTVRVEFTYTEN